MNNIKDQKILNSILNLTTLLPVRHKSPKSKYKNLSSSFRPNQNQICIQVINFSATPLVTINNTRKLKMVTKITEFLKIMILTCELEENKYEVQIQPFLRAVFNGNGESCLQSSPPLTSSYKSRQVCTHTHAQLNNLHKVIKHREKYFSLFS